MCHEPHFTGMGEGRDRIVKVNSHVLGELIVKL